MGEVGEPRKGMETTPEQVYAVPGNLGLEDKYWWIPKHNSHWFCHSGFHSPVAYDISKRNIKNKFPILHPPKHINNKQFLLRLKTGALP